MASMKRPRGGWEERRVNVVGVMKGSGAADAFFALVVVCGPRVNIRFLSSCLRTTSLTIPLGSRSRISRNALYVHDCVYPQGDVANGMRAIGASSCRCGLSLGTCLDSPPNSLAHIERCLDLESMEASGGRRVVYWSSYPSFHY